MTNPKAVPRACQDQSTKTTRNDPHDKELVSGLETMLDHESAFWSGEMAAAANVKVFFEHESRQIKARCTANGDVIAREVKPTAKHIVMEEFWTALEESLEGILKTSFYNGKCGMHSVVHNVIEQVMLDCYEKT